MLQHVMCNITEHAYYGAQHQNMCKEISKNDLLISPLEGMHYGRL